MSRVVIVGGPRTGKTTLAGEGALHTDDLIHLGWSEASQFVCDDWLTQPGPWIVEGVATARALRKALKARPGVKPCDEIWLCVHPVVELSRGQASMAKGVDKVWSEICPALTTLGVKIERQLALKI